MQGTPTPLAIGRAVPGATAGSILYAGAGGILAQDNTNLKWGTTAGQGLTANAGTATTAVSPLALTQTWNAAGVVFPGLTLTITDTASAAGSLAMQILGGAAGATNLFKVDKAGLLTVPTITATTFNVGSSATQLSEFSAGFLLIRGVTANNGGNIRKAGDNGGYVQWASTTELLTLSTGGTTTDTSANLLPADAVIEAVTGRVTTTITTATSWQLGDPTTGGRFTAAQSTMTAGATVAGLVHIDQAAAAGPRQTAAAKVRVTTVGTPGAGIIRITVYYRQFVAPTS